jgi:WD40 repeat protein
MLFRTGVDRLPHPQVVGYLAYDKTGARLATGSHDPVIRIWDPTTSNLTSTIKPDRQTDPSASRTPRTAPSRPGPPREQSRSSPPTGSPAAP